MRKYVIVVVLAALLLSNCLLFVSCDNGVQVGTGIEGVALNDDGQLVITLTDGTELPPVTLPKGEKGSNGTGVASAELNEEGQLVITLTDGTVLPPIDLPENEKTVNYTQGLHFQRIWGKEEYRLIGLGLAAELDIIIPATYNGMPVTEIDSLAFENATWLQSVTIPSGITALSASLFSSIRNIELIVDKENPVYHIAGNCLIETESKTLVCAFKNFEIPTDGSVTSIGDSAFSRFSGFEAITIPACITAIKGGAFYECTGLREISFASNSELSSIGQFAFYGCFSLAAIAIPANVETIGFNAFRGCTNLETVTFLPNSKLNAISYMCFDGCAQLSSITIPSSVTKIESSAFSGCTSLESINIPASVTSIGTDIFKYCTRLESVDFATPEGWWVAPYPTDTSGTSLASADLAQSFTAANYLCSTYSNYHWHRG